MPQHALFILIDRRGRDYSSVARYLINKRSKPSEMIHETYIGVLKDTGVENHMIDPINGSQCSYLSGEVLDCVRIKDQAMRQNS